MRSDKMRLPLDLLAGVGDSNGKAAIAHYRKIDHIVAHKGSLRLAQSFLPEDLLEYSQLVLNALVNVLHLKVAGAQGHGFGNALCDQAGVNNCQTAERDVRTIMLVDVCGLVHGL